MTTSLPLGADAPPPPLDADAAPLPLATGPAASTRWPRLLVPAALAAAVLTVCGFLAAAQLRARSELRTATASLGAARAEWHRALGDLDRAEAALALASVERASARSTLARDAAGLAAAQANLSGAEANLFVAGVSAGDLNTCLGGVQVALNQVALHDPEGALGSLRSVSAACRVVQSGVGPAAGAPAGAG